MKRLCALILALCFLVGFIFSAALASIDSPPVHIQYALYDGFSLEGRVETGEGLYFARTTFFLRNNQYFILIVPISREGLFLADIACDCVSAVVWIVDSPCALVPGQGIFYAGEEVTLLPP